MKRILAITFAICLLMPPAFAQKQQDNMVTVKLSFDDPHQDNILWNKKIAFCGDSFTHGDFSGYVDADGNTGRDSDAFDKEAGIWKAYPWWIAKRNNMELTLNAFCGSTIAITKEYLDAPDSVDIEYRRPFSCTRYKEIPEDVDYILLMFGLNDQNNHTYLGEITDTLNTTFYGAWNFVLKELMLTHPYARIGIISPNGHFKDSYRKAIQEVALKWGIPCFDLLGDPSAPLLLRHDGASEEAVAIRRAQYGVTKDNSHPNLEANKVISEAIEAFIRKL